MGQLDGKRVLLTITGGIAAYKSLDLIRKLQDAGAQVRCALSESGKQFVTPLSVAALSGHAVLEDMFTPDANGHFNHIAASREADLIVVAPATADSIAKMACGIADTLVSTLLLASDKPVLIAPAMNCVMWAHPATQENIAKLAARGVKMVGPASGFLACGEEGAGRMSEPADILQAVVNLLADGPLRGRRALVTSGPTFEAIDPVRFIGNRSSGKQGHAIAAALAALGAEVTLVTGPVALPPPAGLRVVEVESAREMLAACQSGGRFDIAVCAAAVADWRPAQTSAEKIKKNGSAAPALTMTENPDILATLSQAGPDRPTLVIGFAAETEKLAENAAAKFARKGCDWLLANDVAGGKTFGSADNEVTLIRRTAGGSIETTNWPRASKTDIARQLATTIANAFIKDE